MAVYGGGGVRLGFGLEFVIREGKGDIQGGGSPRGDREFDTHPNYRLNYKSKGTGMNAKGSSSKKQNKSYFAGIEELTNRKAIIVLTRFDWPVPQHFL